MVERREDDAYADFSEIWPSRHGVAQENRPFGPTETSIKPMGQKLFKGSKKFSSPDRNQPCILLPKLSHNIKLNSLGEELEQGGPLCRV